MDNESFNQVSILFVFIIVAIGFFHLIGLDTSFIVTFILAVFSIGISLYLSGETKRVADKIVDKIDILHSSVLEKKIGSLKKELKEKEESNNQGENVKLLKEDVIRYFKTKTVRQKK